MYLHRFDSMNALSDYASDAIVSVINVTDSLLLCTATGNSTTETYRKLVGKKDFFPVEKLRIIKLDEWGGVPAENPMTCESYLREKLIGPLQISETNYLGFNSDPADPEQECIRMQQLLDQHGPIGLCILGIGLNGHIAFNEPGDFLTPHCHKAALTASSLNHPMARDMKAAPGYGLTLGMTDIMRSRKILLLISGKNKASITRDLMSRKITTRLPASFLWLHPDVYCLCDREALSLVHVFSNSSFASEN
ncbi:MAG TPA: 6-phosphogluconolactonase [Bacteroidales bacterium]|nr:6-phosphogluconolactonase [Bacteroidales bacterium]